jgi:hypothetical protein
MVQSAQDWCGENYSRSFGQFVLAAQHIRRISARVRKDGPLPRISDNRCGASMSQHHKPEDDYLPSSAQSSHLLAYRMAACSCRRTPGWLQYHSTIQPCKSATNHPGAEHSLTVLCLVQPERRVRILGCDGGEAQSRGGRRSTRSRGQNEREAIGHLRQAIDNAGNLARVTNGCHVHVLGMRHICVDVVGDMKVLHR